MSSLLEIGVFIYTSEIIFMCLNSVQHPVKIKKKVHHAVKRVNVRFLDTSICFPFMKRN